MQVTVMHVIYSNICNKREGQLVCEEETVHIKGAKCWM